MRTRELIKRLKDDRNELRKAAPGLFSSHPTPQQTSMRRLEVLHALENLLPEIIEKLEARTSRIPSDHRNTGDKNG